MESLEIITRLRKLGKRFPTKYLSGVFKKNRVILPMQSVGTNIPNSEKKSSII